MDSERERERCVLTLMGEVAIHNETNGYNFPAPCSRCPTWRDRWIAVHCSSLQRCTHNLGGIGLVSRVFLAFNEWKSVILKSLDPVPGKLHKLPWCVSLILNQLQSYPKTGSPKIHMSRSWGFSKAVTFETFIYIYRFNMPIRILLDVMGCQDHHPKGVMVFP